jgi:antitoxin component YwqK of YwqJK toxin-antitoxin module
MKRRIFLILSIILVSTSFLAGQTTTDKREKKKNLTVKEWNTSAATKTRYLDHVTKFDANGFKIEEIEYANYGQKTRTTFEYNEAGKCIKQTEYDSRNKPVRIRKFEYYPDGSKKKQYNYSPSGKLETTKEFEYIFDK